MLPTTIPEMHRAFAHGELTPLALFDQCWERIQRREANIRAWVMLDEIGARTLAAEQTAWLSNGSNREQPLPPLFGIPIGIKDIIDVAGWPTKAGSKLRDHHIAATDAPIVAQLRSAGAILLGKTVTTEFACFDPPVTRNPWNESHTPGGSSSGSAAAVAAGMCVAAMGSQTGGSILRPASFCGVVGFKPEFNTLSTQGVVPVSHTLDHLGFLCRNVTDAMQLWRACGGEANVPEMKDGDCQWCWLYEFFVEKCHLETETFFRPWRKTYAELEPPVRIEEMHRVHRVIMAYECAQVHAATMRTQPEMFGPAVASLISEGLAIPANVYAETLARREEVRNAWQEILNDDIILLMPTTHGPAPGSLGTTGDPRWQSPWSLCGFPAITIPCWICSTGLPLGVQIVAKSNELVLAAARYWEKELDFPKKAKGQYQ